MTKINVPIIPSDVADAIEEMMRLYGDTQDVIGFVLAYGVKSKLLDVLRSIPFDTLLAALVNGYERGKTPEQLAEEERAARHESLRMLYEAKRRNADAANFAETRVRNEEYADGIVWTLNTLGIEIEGVNV